MIFVGDIALPYKDAIVIETLSSYFYTKNWIGNLEGAIVDGAKEDIGKRIVLNDKRAIDSLLNQFSFKGLALANNHIFDTGDYEATISFLKERGVLYCGIGESAFSASKPMIIESEGQ